MNTIPISIKASDFITGAGERLEGRIDLHVHTVYSDSLFTPQEVVKQARDLGLTAVAVTDHDSVDGVQETWDLCRGAGLELIPGVELSATYRGREVHLLGYMVDHRSESLVRTLDFLKSERLKRTRRILERLSRVGHEVDYGMVLDLAGNGSVGRPHIAEALARMGVVGSFGEAFRRFLAPGAPAYVPRYRLDLRCAFDIIRDAGGLPILAHPGVLKRDHLIPAMVRLGVAGIEVAHPFHNREAIERYVDLANRYGLVPTAGSDCPGPGRGTEALGVVTAPYAVLEIIRRLVGEETAAPRVS